MTLLLDTHTLLWTLARNPKLSGTARAMIGDSANELVISSVSAFEITTKFRIGKLPEFAVIARDFSLVLASLDHSPLPIGMEHAALAGRLDHPHGDPFDRLLIAQSICEGIALVSNEKLFDAFGIERIL